MNTSVLVLHRTIFLTIYISPSSCTKRSLPASKICEDEKTMPGYMLSLAFSAHGVVQYPKILNDLLPTIDKGEKIRGLECVLRLW